MRISSNVSRRSKGFSLLELLIALFIFSIVVSGVTTYFARIVQTNQNSKRLQQNLEDTRFAMSRMTKTLRTSVIIKPIVNGRRESVRVYDYSQEKCLEYEFGTNSLVERVSSSSPGPGVPEKSWCDTLSVSGGDFSENQLISISDASLSGMFSVVPSSTSFAGRVSMKVTITRKNNSSTVQSTVSLRNFKDIYP